MQESGIEGVKSLGDLDNLELESYVSSNLVERGPSWRESCNVYERKCL